MTDWIGKQVQKVFTTRYVCCSCKRAFAVPKNDSGDGIGECEHCGNTSFHISSGRPWGHRHRFWNDWVRSLYSLDDDNKITPETLYCFTGYEDEIPDYLQLQTGGRP